MNTSVNYATLYYHPLRGGFDLMALLTLIRWSMD